MCAGAMYWAQLTRLVFGASDPHRGYKKLGDYTYILKQKFLGWCFIK